MTDRLTPGHLRDLADLAEKMPMNVQGYTFLREEAARREAEKPRRSAAHVPPMSRVAHVPTEGPGSAAAPTEAERNSWVAPIEDKPAPAADDLVARLRGRVSIDWEICEQAADRIEAQAQKIEVQAMEIVEQTNARLSAEARVRELAASLNSCGLRADAEKARADRLAAAMRAALDEVGGQSFRVILTRALTTEGGDRWLR